MKLLYLFLGVLLLGGGVAQTEEALDTEKFSGVLKSYFSSVSPVLSKKPIERTRDLFEEPFIVGECHSHISPKKFLIENMKKMKQNGYEVLFMEHLFYDTNQKDLDEFFKTGKMSTELINQLREMNQHGLGYSFGPSSKITSSLWKNNDYVAVLHAAREAGIRVVGIDISTVYRSQKIGIDNQQLDNTRIRYMNYTAAQIMKREIGFLSKGKKWCGFMGNTHVSTFENTPGVAELLDARSVYVFDQPQWTNSTQPFKGCVDCNGEYIYSSGRAIFKGDAIYELDPRVDTSLFEHPTAIYKEKLAQVAQPKTKLTSDDIELAIKYFSRLEVTELGKLFGFKTSELDSSYHMVQKITPVNPQKTIEESNTFSFIIENNYSHMESYTVYLSKDQILSFSAKQKEIDLQNYKPSN